jgi:dihydrofolate reductase
LPGRVAKTQYYTATSIDGFIADAGNSLDWLFEVGSGSEASNDRFATFMAGVGAMAMGATTYEWVLNHERLLEDPSAWPKYYGATPCWVFTHRDLPAVPGARLEFTQGNVRDVHRQMTAAAEDRNIWLVGGGDLVGQFADEGLLDEILLGVAPVTLGGGAPLLPRRLPSSRLTLTGVDRDDYFAYLSYRVTPSPA